MARPKKKFDPQDILRQIVSSDFDLTRFAEVDERDIPQPSNFVEWITGRAFCDATLLPWQVEAGMHLFSDYCPECSDPEYLADLFNETMGEILDHVVFLKQGVCPKCKKNRLELFTPGILHPSKPSLKNEFIGNMGQRIGKSKFLVSAGCYQTNQWVRLPDPHEFYNLPKMEVVLGTFSALSAEQAEENLWMPFKALYDQAPWFKKYNEFLRSEEKRLSVPLCDIGGTYIFYPHKRLLLSFTGADDRKKRGRTRLFGQIDEIAYLNTEEGTSKKKVMDADKNYAALNNSLSTIRQKALNKIATGHFDVPLAIMYNASSPYNVQDKIMRLTKSGPDNPFAVVMHKATWEGNPDFTEHSLRAQNQALSQAEFDRDFGAVPPFSDSPYIGDARVLEKLCLPPDKHQALIVATREIHKDQMGDSYLYLKAKIARPDKNTPLLLALDNGYNHNAFGAAIFGFDGIKKKAILRALFSLYPDPSNGLSIHFPSMFEHFIIPLVKYLRIHHIIYDRWQSLDQIQRLRDMKINAQAHSLSFEKDLLPFKQMLLSGNMILPPCEMPIQDVKDAPNPTHVTRDKPVANLIWQALTVRQVRRKVLKPLEGDDDLFRAFVLGGSRFLAEDIQKQYASFNGVRQSLQGGFVGSYNSMKKVGGMAPGAPAQVASNFASYRGFTRGAGRK